ncbi:MAG: hypothetical protein DRI90_02105 [Deltaproteobacteria bacterium]|nr:MAG: hypothetical protein DRI90_02105 [Deltaproteobacteria bacterium]
MTHAIANSQSNLLSNRKPSRSAGLLASAMGILLSALVGCANVDDGTSEDGDPSESTGDTLQCGAVELYLQAHDDCGAMDATAIPDENGSCFCMLGYAWDGSECVGLADCLCEGADCTKLTETIEACEAAHSECGSSPQGLSCGDPQLYLAPHTICDPMDAAAAPDENGAGCFCMLGYAWDGNECVGLGDCQCLGADCDKLTQTMEECEAAHTICQ